MEKMLLLFVVVFGCVLVIAMIKSTVHKPKLLYPAVIILGVIFLVKGVWGAIEIFPLLTQEPAGVGLPKNYPSHLPA